MMGDMEMNIEDLSTNPNPSEPTSNAAEVAIKLKQRGRNETDLSNFDQDSHGSWRSSVDHWQSDQYNMMGRLSYLLFNKRMSDVTFCVGPEKEDIPAHKFILSISSSVFEAMFYGRLASESNEIAVPDIEPTAFRNLLRFLYTDEVCVEPDTVMATLYTAKKYVVPTLEDQCVAFLEQSLSTDNAFLLLTQARLFDVPRLIMQCYDLIDRHTQACLNSDCFLEIDNNTLEAVLTRDTLRVREIVLYQAVIRWADADCQHKNLLLCASSRRGALKNCANLIRYPLMSSQEFAAGPAQDGLLTDKQMVQLFLYFNLNPKPTSEFLDKPRCCMTGRELVCCRFYEVDSRWGYSGASDRIRFQVDQRIFVAGFGLYGSIHGPAEYDVDIELIYTATNNTIASHKTKFNCDGSNRTFRVVFKEPVEVLPHTNYAAVATIKGRDSFYGTRGVRKMSLPCKNDTNHITFQFSYASGTNNGTSVEDGQIPEIIFYA